MKQLLLFILAILLNTNASAESLSCSGHVVGTATDICSAITAIYPNANTPSLELEKGDLNADGIDDVVYAAYLKESNDFVIGVLQGQTNGQFTSWAQSKKFKPLQHAPELLIKRGSFYILRFNNTLTDSDSTEIQFKYIGGEFLKIGEEDDFESPLHEDSPGPKISLKTSTNFLTYVQIQTNSDDGKVTTVRKKLPKAPLENLKDFGF